jgi:hypothetical protein
MSTNSDETQRELERRALKNVRGLVEKIEANETSDRRTQRRILVAILVIALVIAGGIAWTLHSRQGKPTGIVIDPAKLPPIRPGPPK